MSLHAALDLLATDLPNSGDAADVDVQCRFVLVDLVGHALDHERMDPVPEDPETCPNCSTSMSSGASPYCSDECRAESAFVRQFRRSLLEGTALNRDRQIALGEKYWRLIGGGYPRRQAMATERTLKQVFKRTQGLCEECGALATTVDHTGSG